MVGIVGILKLKDNSFDIRNLLIAMSEAVKHEKWYKSDKYISDPIGLSKVGLGILNPEPQPIFNEELCIMMEGEIYDYKDLKNDLVSKGHKFLVNNDPEFILHLYQECGEDFAYKLNGSFVVVIWDDKKRKLLIITDRHGLRPLYYTKSDDKLLFGSEVKAILADKAFKRNINDEAVSDFFSFGYLLGNKTFFQDINLLPPASILVCQNGQISIREYWNFDFVGNYEEYSENYYVKNLYRLWLQAVERQMKGNHRIGALLSGGLDSRMVVGAIHTKHYPIDTFTFGKPNCEDIKFAQIVSNKLGTQHHFFELPPDHLVWTAEKSVYLTDGMTNVVSPIAPFQGEIKNHSDVVLIGLVGDLIIGGNSIFDECISNHDLSIDELTKLVFGHVNSPITVEMAPLFFSKEYYKKIEGMAFNSFVKEFKKNVVNCNHINYFLIRSWGRRFLILGQHVCACSHLEFRHPFFDNDFTDFVFKIPIKLLKNSYIYTKTFKKMFPELSEIPWRPKDPSQSTYIQRIKRKSIRKINRVFEKMGYNPIIEDKREYHDYNNWMRKNPNLKSWILKILLDEKTLSRLYFNQKYIKKILDQHMSGKVNNDRIIGLLLTFELWHRQFIDSD